MSVANTLSTRVSPHDRIVHAVTRSFKFVIQTMCPVSLVGQVSRNGSTVAYD